jgi:hypothetical protein
MRWDALFADLEARVGAEERAAHDAEVAELSRHEIGAITLVDRLRGHRGGPLVLELTTGDQVRGRVTGVAADAVLLAEVTRRRVLVPVPAIVSIRGLGRAAIEEASPVRSALSLRHVLRALARERTPVRLATSGGTVACTIRRVAADHVDLDLVDRADDGHVWAAGHDGLEGHGRVAGDVDGDPSAGSTVRLAALVAVRFV